MLTKGPKPNLFLMGHPRYLFVYFRSFQTNSTNFTTNECENVHLVLGFKLTTYLTSSLFQ